MNLGLTPQLNQGSTKNSCDAGFSFGFLFFFCPLSFHPSPLLSLFPILPNCFYSEDVIKMEFSPCNLKSFHFFYLTQMLKRFSELCFPQFMPFVGECYALVSLCLL